MRIFFFLVKKKNDRVHTAQAVQTVAEPGLFSLHQCLGSWTSCGTVAELTKQPSSIMHQDVPDDVLAWLAGQVSSS